MDRRTMLFGMISAMMLSRIRLLSTEVAPNPYFSGYSLGGLMEVLDKTSDPNDQAGAIELIVDRAREGEHSHLFMDGDALSKYGRGVGIEDIAAMTDHPFLCMRGSDAYFLLTGLVPAPFRQRVRDATDWFCLHPNVRSRRDSDSFNTAGLAYRKQGGFMIQPSTFPDSIGRARMIGYMVHEAEHLATEWTSTLVDEIGAHRIHRDVLIYMSNQGIAGLEDDIAFYGKAVQMGEYLASQAFTNRFLGVYPQAELTGKDLLRAGIGKETLQWCGSLDGEGYLADTLREACGDATQELTVPVSAEESASAPVVSAHRSTRRQIPDPGVDAPRIIR